MEDSEVRLDHSGEQSSGDVPSVETDSKASGEGDALTEEEVAFALWALQLGGYLRSLLETDPRAAAQELEAAAEHLRQMAGDGSGSDSARDAASGSGAAKADGVGSVSASGSGSSAAERDSLEEVVRAAVERAIAEKMKQVLASPPSLHGSPVSGRRLADLIE